MHRLTLLIVALAVAYWGVSVLAETEPFAAYVVRDGVLLAALGSLLYARFAGGLPPLERATVFFRWERNGRFLFGVGIAFTLAAAIILLRGGDGHFSESVGLTLWALGAASIVGGVWWPNGLPEYVRPAYRWVRDAAGHFVRVPIGEETYEAGTEIPRRERLRMTETSRLVWPFALALAVAVYISLSGLTVRPPDCLEAECVWALRLEEGSAASAQAPLPGSFDLLARTLHRLTGNGLYSLRLATALISLTMVLLFYALAQRYVSSGAAEIGAILLAFNPWRLWTGRITEPASVAALLVCLVLWTATQATRSQDRRWWAGMGVALGLLYVEAPSIRAGVPVWLIVLILAGIAALPGRVHWGRVAGIALIPLSVAAAIALPILARSAQPPVVEVGPNYVMLLASLLRPGAVMSIDFFAENALVGALLATFVVAGIGTLARSTHLPHAAWALAGIVAFGAALARTDLTGAQASALLALLPFLMLAAVVALDQLLVAFQETWRPVIAPERALAAALALVIVVAGWRSLQLTRDLERVRTPARTSADAAMGRYLALCLDENIADMPDSCAPRSSNPFFFVPPTTLDNPTVRLMAGSRIDESRVREMDLARDLLPITLGADALYLVPMDQQPLLDLLRQTYPDADVRAEPQSEGASLFVALRVPAEELAQRQGLPGVYFAGMEFGAETDIITESRDGSLVFDWQLSAPVEGAMSARWEGALIVPESGVYGFDVLMEAAPESNTQFTLQLDGSLILDTSLGLTEKFESLAQGVYRLTILLRAESAPRRWEVRWQTPASAFAPIPRSALTGPSPPNVGLLGAYYAGDQFQGQTVALRKDPILGMPVDLPSNHTEGYGVRWQGKIAAPRSGEYLFAVNSTGDLQLLIDGRSLLDYFGGVTPPDQGQASIYLARGWHFVEVRYIPDIAQPSLRILWQPPGSGPLLLFSRYLSPILTDVTEADLPLPAAPELIDARLGDDNFALSYPSEMAQPSTSYPPEDLPALLLEEMWTAGGACGAGDEQLAGPRGVAIDVDTGADAGRVYAADTGNRRLLVYALASGERLTAITSPSFEEPVDVALGLEGEVYVLDAGTQQIVQVDAESGEANAVPMATTFYRPRGMGVDAGGYLWVADTGGGRVVMLDPGGRVAVQIGGPGSQLAVGQPVDVIVPNGLQWAISAEDGRLWRLDLLAGLTAIPRTNTIDGPHIADLPDGTFFVTDPARRTVLYFAADGEPLRRFAYTDTFVTPVGVGAAADVGATYLAVTDVAKCTVSLWRGPAPTEQK